MPELPDAHTGLPKPIERRLLKPYADTMTGRVGSAALLRSLSVLVRKHPAAAFDMLRAGVAQAGRTFYSDIRDRLFARPKRAEKRAAKAEAQAEVVREDALAKPSSGETAEARRLAEARRELAEKLGEPELERIRKMLDASEAPDDSPRARDVQ